MLASTEFLFRIERDPRRRRAADTPYRVSDLELASRLSFFLWSSIPDDELLDAGRSRASCSEPAVLERQVRRMLADPRAEALVTNFAGQWLYLRNLAAASPDARLFPDFDDNLRQAFRRETELFFESIVRGRPQRARPAARELHVRQRAAGQALRHSERVRQPLPARHARRGQRARRLLGHGSILTVTSYANRTSPVLRGKWILENILGTPPPPPPPNVPPLQDTDAGGTVAVDARAHGAAPRESRLRQLPSADGSGRPVAGELRRHRPLARRAPRRDAPSMRRAACPTDPTFDGMAGLRAALLRSARSCSSATLTEKLLTYALGRGLEYYDAPAVRAIVARRARRSDYPVLVARARRSSTERRRFRWRSRSRE